MPRSASASAYMIRALASVLPQPVEAMLTINAPACNDLSRMAPDVSAALSCQRKRSSLERFLSPLWRAKRGSCVSNFGSEWVTSAPCCATPSKCSSSV